MPTRFLIFAQGRTGTWLLHDLLNSHPRIGCSKEILEYPVFFPMRHVTGCARRCRHPVFGFHLQIKHLTETQGVEPGRFLRRLSRDGWSILHLWRRNIVRQSISTLIALQRREWYTTKADPLKGQRFRVDGEALKHWLERRERHLAQERDILRDLPHLELVYEDHLEDAAVHQTTMDMIFAYLGVAPEPVQARVRRISPPHLSDYVANHEELARQLRGTPFAHHLT